MRTYHGQQAIQIWLLGAAMLLGGFWWSASWVAPFLVGGAALLAALEMTNTLYPQRSRTWHWVSIGGCGVFAAGIGAVWLLFLPLAITTLVLLVLATILIRQRRPQEIDHLTGLLHSAVFTARAEDELSRGLRFGRPAAVAVIVFDQAVAIRQAYGRQTARMALQRIAEGVASQSRNYDLLTRLDNTRFAILLPETTHEEALSAAERIRTTIAAHPFVPASTEITLPLAVDVGIAHHPQDGDAIQILLDKASQRGTVTSTARHEPMTAPKVTASTPAAVPMKPPGKIRPQWYQFAYITAVWFLGLLVYALTYQPIEPQQWLFFLTLAVIAVASRQMRIELYGRGSVANHFVALLAGGIFISPTAAMLLGVASGWILLPSKMKPRAFIFDAASFALSAGGATLFARGIAPYFPATGLFHWPLIVQGLLLGGACYLINLCLLIGIVSCAEGGNSLAIWRERYSWFLPYTLIFGVLAVFMVEAGKALGPLGMIVFAIPTFMMRFVTKQYVDRTKDYVVALREAHNHLTKANEELRETVDALEHSYSATLSAFSGMLDARDSETEGHSQRVVTYALAIGRAMQLEAQELAALEVGALLHDIGKVGVSDAILRKKGPLNDAEWVEMRRHPEIGHQLTSGIPFLHTASPVVRHHHERWDGKGYPDRLHGENIPLVARIFAVADSFDAMISDRPYRRGLSYEQAIEELQRVAGVQFDPQVIETFLQLITTPDWIETVKKTAQAVQLPAQQSLPAQQPHTLVSAPSR